MVFKKNNKKSYLTTPKKKKFPTGYIYINSTFNNTFLTLTDIEYKPLVCLSPKKIGNLKKKVPYNNLYVAENLAQKAKEKKIFYVKIFFYGVPFSRVHILKGLKKEGIKVTSMINLTSIPHNGCRMRKKKRK